MRTRPKTPPLMDVLAAAERVAKAHGTPAPRPVDAGPRRDARGYLMPDQIRPGHHVGRVPPNAGQKYPPNPPPIEECMAMLRTAGERTGRYEADGIRLQAAIILMWQGALRAFEALSIAEDDLETETGRLQIRCGKGGKQATITMAAWAWPLLEPWRQLRQAFPVGDGKLLCVIDGPTAGRAWSYSDLNREVKRCARQAGVTRRMSCHQFRHGWAVQAYQGSVPLRTIQLHLRHSNIGITDTYLQGMGSGESQAQVYAQPVPMVPATVMLELAKGVL